MRRSRRVGWMAVVLAGSLCVAGMPLARGAESPLKAGQRVSLDLKGVDILDVLKLLSQQSGLNFIAGRNVTGRVTIFVNDVDVWEAFELLIGANDLAYERRGDIVTVMTARDYELIYGERFQERKETFTRTLQYAKAVQAAAVLNQVKSAVGRVVADEATNTLIVTDMPARLAEMREFVDRLDRPTATRIYTLNYAEAEQLKEKVQDLLSPVGTFTFDVRTNKAIVSDLKEVLPRIDQMVQAFDTPEGQVLIEAKIVKVDLTDEMKLGIDWQQVLGGIDISARGNFRVLDDIVGGTATGGALKFLEGPQNRAQVILEALRQITNTETISNPRLMVSNNQEARILVGTKEAVVTVTTTIPSVGSTVSAPEIQFVDVGTKLYVTPNIKHDGHIQIKIRPEVSTSTVETFQTNRIPIVTSTEAETNVLVKSGSTLIIGGLIQTTDDKTDNRVPVLGDIPILGAPFRGSTATKEKSEIVVFLTPQIILPDGTPYDASSADAQGGLLPPAYRQAVRQRLQELLASRFRDASLPGGSVEVSFVLNRAGRLVGAQEITSPQGLPFVEATQIALAKGQPFPPFPGSVPDEEVRFKLAVEYAP